MPVGLQRGFNSCHRYENILELSIAHFASPEYEQRGPQK